MTSLVTFHPLRVLDATLADRTEPFADWDDLPPIPPQPVEAYRDPQWLACYDGIHIYKLNTGVVWNPETGCAWSVEQAKQDIDEWRERREREFLTEGPCDPMGFEW